VVFQEDERSISIVHPAKGIEYLQEHETEHMYLKYEGVVLLKISSEAKLETGEGHGY
jgi:hypothetical protein